MGIEKAKTNQSLNNFYKSKRVLITGHTGFKGGWLSLWLAKLGAQVIGYAKEPPTSPSLFEVCNIADKVTSIIGDVKDIENLGNVFEKYQPEIVFHMAAQALVRYSYKEPVETFETNVMGTVNVLEGCRHSKTVRAIVNITSDKCYENQESRQGYIEGDMLGGYDPYSSSKAAAELVTGAYLQSFFNPEDHNSHEIGLASARAGNVIGGGDWADDRIIPDCIKAFMNKKEVVIRSPDAVRPWQHVMEPLYGYLLLGQHLYSDGSNFSGAWNFGPEDENLKPVKWILDQMIDSWGEDSSWTINEGENPHETNYLKLDSSKAKSRLGWYPKWDIDRSLKKTIEWYKSYKNGENMLNITTNHLNDYEKTIGQNIS